MNQFGASIEETTIELAVGTFAGTRKLRRSLNEHSLRGPRVMTEPTTSSSPSDSCSGSDISPSRPRSHSTLSMNSGATSVPPDVAHLGAVTLRQDNPRDRWSDARVRRSLTPRPPCEQPSGGATFDDPAVLCSTIRSLARISHELLSRTRPGATFPSRGEINDILRRLIGLQHQLDRYRVLHGLRTGRAREVDRKFAPKGARGVRFPMRCCVVSIPHRADAVPRSLASSGRDEPRVDPVGPILAIAVSRVGGDQADPPGPAGDRDVESPGILRDPHHRAGGNLLAVDEDLEDDARVLRHVRSVGRLEDVLVHARPGRRIVRSRATGRT